MNNPPAFPTPLQHNDWREDYPGMTLRDYFAGQALAGISAHLRGATINEPETSAQAHARWAYAAADAMMEARDAAQ
jgi:hypothetical protein